MRILVDFLPVLPRGGGLQNARNLWRAIGEHGGEHRWLARARPGLGLHAMTRGTHQELRVREAGGALARAVDGAVGLASLARRWDADVVLTPMGAGPLRSPVPVVMGWHDATVAYPELGLDAGGPLQRRWRSGYAGRAAARAARICVQTPSMARRLAAVWDVPLERFRVIANGPSGFLADECPAPATPPPGPLRVLCLGDPKPAKNLEVVPAVAAALARRGATDVELTLTVGEDAGPYGAPLEAAFARHGDGVVVHRRGRVPHAELGPVYRAASAVLLPSLLESFSATYVEAMHFGVPLVTSDRDFAVDVCGPAAVYADPLDPDALADAVLSVLRDPDLRRRLREAGFQRAAGFPGWEERLGLYLAACREAVGEAGGRPAPPSAEPVPVEAR